MLSFEKAAEQARTPYRGSAGACGLDLPLPHNVSILPSQRVEIDLYLKVRLPVGCFGLLKLRSSVARRYHITLLGGVIGKPSTFSAIPVHAFFFQIRITTETSISSSKTAAPPTSTFAKVTATSS
jgi:dUTPase